MKGTIAQKDLNILIGDHVRGSDWDLFFGPIKPTDNFEVLLDTATMPDILVAAGVFATKSQARKNGWGARRPATFKWNQRLLCKVVDEPGIQVPEGFTCFRSGKGKAVRIAILKLTDENHNCQ